MHFVLCLGVLERLSINCTIDSFLGFCYTVKSCHLYHGLYTLKEAFKHMLKRLLIFKIIAVNYFLKYCIQKTVFSSKKQVLKCKSTAL